MNQLSRHALFGLVALVGAFALGTVALHRGESINALWIVVAAVSVYLIAYRYYGLFIARTVMKLDANRATPAIVHNDGLDYVPTNKNVLFGHHFAAIAGAGPLVGPVLAAQLGYLPGMLWILAGVVFAGAVQDFMVLFISTRRDGRSLGDLIKSEMGAVPGVIALFGTFMIMVIILAVLALIVVKALAESPWGAFTVAAHFRFDQIAQRAAIAAGGDKQHHEILHRAGKHHASQNPQHAGQIAQLSRQHRAHQRAGAGNGGKVVAEQHVFIGGHVVQAIIVHNRRGGAIGVQLHHRAGDKQAIVAVGNQINRDGGHHNPQGIDGFAAMQRHRAQRECADQRHQPEQGVAGQLIHDSSPDDLDVRARCVGAPTSDKREQAPSRSPRGTRAGGLRRQRICARRQGRGHGADGAGLRQRPGLGSTMAFCVSVHIRTTTGRRYAVLRSAVQQSHGTQTQNSGAYRAAAAAGDCGGGRAGAIPRRAVGRTTGRPAGRKPAGQQTRRAQALCRAGLKLDRAAVRQPTAIARTGADTGQGDLAGAELWR
jgi:hypothetical protein